MQNNEKIGSLGGITNPYYKKLFSSSLANLEDGERRDSIKYTDVQFLAQTGLFGGTNRLFQDKLSAAQLSTKRWGSPKKQSTKKSGATSRENSVYESQQGDTSPTKYSQKKSSVKLVPGPKKKKVNFSAFQRNRENAEDQYRMSIQVND